MTTETTKAKYWAGRAPTHCDISRKPITDCFIDGATIHGPWANMHPDTHKTHGRGLGTGRGQKYKKQLDGRWLKVEG